MRYFLTGLALCFMMPALAAPDVKIKVNLPFLHDCNTDKASKRGRSDAQNNKESSTSFLQRCPKPLQGAAIAAYQSAYHQVKSTQAEQPRQLVSECSGLTAYRMGVRDGRAGTPANTRYKDTCPRQKRVSIVRSYLAGYQDGRSQSGRTDVKEDNFFDIEKARERRAMRRQEILSRACKIKIAAKAGYLDGKQFNERRKRYIQFCPRESQAALYSAYAKGFSHAMAGNPDATNNSACSRAGAVRLGAKDGRNYTTQGIKILRGCPGSMKNQLMQGYREGYRRAMGGNR